MINKFKKSMEHCPQISSNNTDSKIIGSDGRSIPIHSILLIVNSSLFKNIHNSLEDNTDVVVIVPDFSTSELEELISVVYGKSETGVVSGEILNNLGMEHCKIWMLKESITNFEEESEIIFEYGDNLDEIHGGVPLTEEIVVPDPSNNEILLFPPINMVSRTLVDEREIIEPEIQVFQTVIQDDLINEVEISDNNQANCLECSICSKTFKTKKTLKQHLKLIHKHGPPDPELAPIPMNKQCCVCNQYFTSIQLPQHLKHFHPEFKRKFNCNL